MNNESDQVMEYGIRVKLNTDHLLLIYYQETQILHIVYVLLTHIENQYPVYEVI
jgi:hypothetical protein